jgi:tetratricopeptide (TPR) repeat protein
MKYLFKNSGVRLKNILLTLLALILLSSAVYAQGTKFDSLANLGIKQIYDIKFEQAEKTFRELIADYPDHPAGRFFLAMIDWWKILLNPDDESHDEIFFQKLEDVIYQCDQLLDKNPENVDALFFKGGAIGFRGRLRSLRESWLKAADDGREALPIVERASNLDPDNKDVQLGFGIYDYYASVIPDEYPLLKPLMIFFPSGDKEKGLRELKNTAENGKYAKYEARYFLMTLYYNYENNPFKAYEYASMLNDEFPDNPVFERWKGRISARKGDYAGSAKIFKDVLMKADSGYTGYTVLPAKREAVYYVGLQYKNTDDLDSSEYYFKKCVDYSKDLDKDGESGFWINSVLYLGMINDQMGNRGKALDYYNDLLDMKEYGSSHSLARKYIEKPYHP